MSPPEPGLGFRAASSCVEDGKVLCKLCAPTVSTLHSQDAVWTEQLLWLVQNCSSFNWNIPSSPLVLCNPGGLLTL